MPDIFLATFKQIASLLINSGRKHCCGFLCALSDGGVNQLVGFIDGWNRAIIIHNIT